MSPQVSRSRAYHVSCLTITPDGSRALTGEVDGLTVWDLRKRRPIRFIDSAPLAEELGKKFRDPRSIVMMSHSSGIACTYAESSYVSMWNVWRGTLKRINHYDVEGLSGAITFTPDGRRVLLNYYEAQLLYAVDLKSGRGRGKGINVATNEASIVDATLTPDQKYLAARDRAGVVFFWDVRPGNYNLIHEIDTGQEDYKGDVYISPNGRYFAIAEPFIRVWDAETGKLVLERSFGGAMAFTPDDRSVIFGECVSEASCLDMNLSLHDVATGKRLGSFDGTTSASHAMAVSPDGKLLMSGHIDGTVRFWDLETYKLLDAIGNNAVR